jgi:hypothetical protein
MKNMKSIPRKKQNAKRTLKSGFLNIASSTFPTRSRCSEAGKQVDFNTKPKDYDEETEEGQGPKGKKRVISRLLLRLCKSCPKRTRKSGQNLPIFYI